MNCSIKENELEGYWDDMASLFEENLEYFPFQSKKHFKQFLIQTETELKFDQAIRIYLQKLPNLPNDLLKFYIQLLGNQLTDVHQNDEEEFFLVSDMWCEIADYTFRLSKKAK